MAKRPKKQQPRRQQRGMPTLEFHDEPTEFLKAARQHLAADPVVSSVVATNSEKSVREDADGLEHGLPHRWWVVARDDLGEIAGVGMRTAPFEPHPLFLLPMPTDSAAALAHVLHARRERVDGVNGALPAAKICAGELARLSGRTAEVAVHTRLHEAARVVAPEPCTGRLRLAREEEAALAVTWFDAFARDADVQAGREAGHHGMAEDEQRMARRIDEERVWFWVDDDDRPVHLTGANLPAYAATRIGPVFTPAEHRGKGYAANAVAQVTQLVLDAGQRPCLYTDQANPVSNDLYARLGYEPVVDMVDMRIF